MKEIIKKPGGIIIPSDTAHLQVLDEFLEETLRDFRMPDSDIADVAISVTELANNAIVHGNKNNPDKIVDVRIKLLSNEVEITVSDEGSGFNESIIPDPLSNENILKETGRGIFIVRSLMDKVLITTGKSGNTVVQLFKKFTAEEE
ncbi:MAG: ATP-binding protein [candidate division Zixibacteria bacterium]|nr:ATP-binding protein [candidate division Zixibacteria bacterium]